jgi:threonine dehydrogenase-like Zn-dependent dehydrogenase
VLRNLQVVFEAAGGPIGLRETDVPATPRDGAVVRVELAGVCATDLHLWRGEIPGWRFPLQPGHELAGVVEDVGPDHPLDLRGRPVRPGDRVVVMPATPRPSSPAAKLAEVVPAADEWDVLGFSPLERPAGGGWARYVLVADATARLVVTHAPPAAAVLTEPAATPVEGLRRIGIELGDSVLVQGTGTVGLLAIAAAAAAGASLIAAIGGPSQRLALARALGASVTVDLAEVPDEAERAALARDATPRRAGFDLVIECAGRPAALPEGLALVAPGGGYLELGHFSDVGTVEINPYTHLLSRDLRLQASSGYRARSFLKALQLVEARADELAALVDPVLPLERARDAITALTPEAGWRIDGREVVKIALDPWHGDGAAP